MGEEKIIKCAYKECALPESNTHYWWQFFIYLLSAILLQRDENYFSFFSIFMFCAPITGDLLTSGVKGFWSKIFKWVMVLHNAILVLFCLLGFSGYIIDKNGVFTTGIAPIALPVFNVSKSIVFYSVLFDLFVPIILLLGTPTKKTNDALVYVFKEIK